MTTAIYRADGRVISWTSLLDEDDTDYVDLFEWFYEPLRDFADEEIANDCEQEIRDRWLVPEGRDALLGFIAEVRSVTEWCDGPRTLQEWADDENASEARVGSGRHWIVIGDALYVEGGPAHQQLLGAAAFAARGSDGAAAWSSACTVAADVAFVG